MIGKGARVVTFFKKQPIFTQGRAAGAVFYILEGKVRITVVSKRGNEATLNLLSEGDFFGDGGLAGQALRMGSATAMADCEVLQINKKAMLPALRRERTFSDLYLAYVIERNIQYHEALVDQLFDSSEKRLARILLSLALFAEKSTPETMILNVSHETLAEMACTTVARVSFFINRFKDSGYVANSDAGLQIHRTLLNAVLQG
jgi:CRP-like cAMP-binding protein